jgi:hypothetical protein
MMSQQFETKMSVGVQWSVVGDRRRNDVTASLASSPARNSRANWKDKYTIDLVLRCPSKSTIIIQQALVAEGKVGEDTYKT